MTRRFGRCCVVLVPRRRRPDFRTRPRRATWSRPPRSRGITILEVLVVIGLILIAIAFLIPTRIHHEHGSNRIKCASNLRQIGQAILLYSNDNKGAYPRTRFASGAVVTPTWGTGAPTTQPFADDGPAPNDVTAALFLLLRTQDITSEVFICPTSNEERWDFGGGDNTAANWSNWNGAEGIMKNLSYSYQNPYPNDEAVRMGFRLNNSLTADFAVAADMNPGVSGNSNVLSVTTTSSAREMKAGNSTAHDQDGQNVLYGDGHVNFEQTPFVGVQRDNIYTTRNSSTAFTGGPVVGSPYDGNDSILLPTR